VCALGLQQRPVILRIADYYYGTTTMYGRLRLPLEFVAAGVVVRLDLQGGMGHGVPLT
jgi:hypothetical protein